VYRYAFQGQELDKETGMEAFQLRLWDGRIGRWLNPDPYGQFYSPYIGMGNNPVIGIDPDGGYCPNCPTGIFTDGATFTGSDGGTYVHMNGGWSSGPEVYFSATVHKSSNNASFYGNLDYTNDLLSTSFEMGALLGNTEKYADALKNNKFVYNFNGSDKLWSMNYYGGGKAKISNFSISQAKYSTQILGKVGTGLKYAGSVLGVLAIASNEAQYREGLISNEELYKGRLDGIAGFVMPVASLGVAPGNYFGKKYNKEITHDVIHNKGYLNRATVKFLNFFGLPASSEQTKSGF
jgi:RHS repeat-associated protein